MKLEDVVDTGEACALLGGLHRSTLSRWVQIGRLTPIRRVGRVYLFKRRDIEVLAKKLADIEAITKKLAEPAT